VTPRGRTSFFLCLQGLLLAACTTAPPADGPAWRTQRARLEALDHWQLDAKVALRTDGASETGRLTWEQREAAFTATLAGPFGAGALVITRRGDRLEVRDGETVRTLPADDPGALEAATGWAVPVAALPWWLRALPDPAGGRARLRFENGRPARLEQGDWVISYGAYTAAGDLLLPQALTARHAAGGLELRLAAARWRAGVPQ
jgi:outer membrane lipoprotein LolB